MDRCGNNRLFYKTLFPGSGLHGPEIQERSRPGDPVRRPLAHGDPRRHLEGRLRHDRLGALPRRGHEGAVREDQEVRLLRVGKNTPINFSKSLTLSLTFRPFVAQPGADPIKYFSVELR